MAEKKPFSITDFYLILAMVIWGTDLLFAKIALREVTPMNFAAMRTAISAVILISLFLHREKNWSVPRRHFSWLVGLAFLGTFTNRYLSSLGVSLTTASNSGLLMSISPVVVLLLSFLFFRTEVTLRGALGILISFFGVFLVIQGDWKGWAVSSETFQGDLILLLATSCWALFTILAKRVLKEYSSLKVSAYLIGIGTIFFLPFLPNDKGGGWGEISSLAWLSILYVGIMGNSLAYFLYIRGIQNIGPLRTILYQYLMPLTAMLMAVPFLNETVSASQIWGMGVIFGGIFLARSE